MHKIIILALYGIKTGTCPIMDGNNIKNDNLGWQGVIEFKPQFVQVRFEHICLKKILHGMNASIGSPAAKDGGRCFQDLFQSRFDDFLNGQ